VTNSPLQSRTADPVRSLNKPPPQNVLTESYHPLGKTSWPSPIRLGQETFGDQAKSLLAATCDRVAE